MHSTYFIVIVIAVCFYSCYFIMNFYGIALSGLTMLYNLPILLMNNLFSSFIDFILGFMINH